MAEDKKPKAKVLDFSKVKDRGRYNPKHVSEGPYKAKVAGVVETEAKTDEEDMWVFEIHLQGVKRSGSYPYYCKLQANQMWKVRNLFTAAGLKVPKKKVKVDPTKLVDRLIGVEMEDDEYEGRLKSVISDVFPLSELDDRDLPDASDDDEEVDESEETEDEDEDEEVEDEDLEEIDIEEV